MTGAMTETIDIGLVTGVALPALIPDLARLRVQVFRDWPYLYDGDEAYERDYLQIYLQSPRAAVIVARSDGGIMGASTCLPLTDETAEVQAPFLAAGYDPARFFYFGESVLLPAWRGRGIGVAFFRAREAHASAVSACDYAAFCAVQRPDDHPSRPPGYTKLDAFWTRRGFSQRPDLRCMMDWKDVGAPERTAKPLIFWLKSLTGAALP